METDPSPVRSLPAGVQPHEEVAGVYRPVGWPPPVAAEPRGSRRTREVLTALAEAVAPWDRNFEPSATALEETVSMLEDFIAHATPSVRLSLPLGLHVLDWATWLRRGRRFSRLPVAAREEVLTRWEKSRFVARREAILKYVAICELCWFTTGEVLGHLGHDPEPTVRRLVAERRTRHGEPPL